jgi:putative membrane protein
MPSEQRLHPASLLFSFGRSLRAFALPYLLVLFTASRSSGPSVTFGPVRTPNVNWEAWAMILLIPSALAAIARYLSFRLRYEATELVIRSGIIFRNERHVPYARIQNLDAVQNVFHRLLGVIEVRVDTGSGKGPEATISVIPAAAFEDMRHRVFAGRAPVATPVDTEAAAESPHAATVEDATTLLHLPLRELSLFGWLENSGFLVIGATMGLLWQFDLFDSVGNFVFGDGTFGRSVARDVFGAVIGGTRLPLGEILLVVAVVVAVLVIVQLLSIGWAIIRLHDFHLVRVGEDLRTKYGLLTRVTSTIPLRRIQTLTIRQGPLERLVNRVSVRVETAGGGRGEGDKRREREWLAPIIRRDELPVLVRQIQPELELDAVDWQPAHPRAFRRAAKRAVFLACFVSALSITPLDRWAGAGPWALAVLAVALPWTLFSAHRYVRHLGWAASDDLVLFRTGWLWRNLTVARSAKIQAVTLVESPFDRRAGMGRVRVDTAGASERSHRVDIPYLARDVADRLYTRLAAQAANTTFRW